MDRHINTLDYNSNSNASDSRSRENKTCSITRNEAQLDFQDTDPPYNLHFENSCIRNNSSVLDKEIFKEKMLYSLIPKHKPYFTFSMILICLIFMLWTFSVNDWEIEPLSENPSVGVSIETLIYCGAKEYDLIVYNGEAWRIFIAMFLHAGIVHFVFNMTALFSIGLVLEQDFGSAKIGFIYLVSGIFSTLVSAIFLPSQVMVGASGAIFGLLGALWADIFQNWGVKKCKFATFFALFIITMINVILGFMPYLDNFAHLGGLLMGFLAALPLVIHSRYDQNHQKQRVAIYQHLFQLLGILSVIILLLVGFIVLYMASPSYNWCPWCKNISCIEFPPGKHPYWRCDDCNLSGFEAKINNDGVVILTCPNEKTVDALNCDTYSESGLTTCCIDNCL